MGEDFHSPLKFALKTATRSFGLCQTDPGKSTQAVYNGWKVETSQRHRDMLHHVLRPALVLGIVGERGFHLVQYVVQWVGDTGGIPAQRTTCTVGRLYLWSRSFCLGGGLQEWSCPDVHTHAAWLPEAAESLLSVWDSPCSHLAHPLFDQHPSQTGSHREIFEI